MAGANLDPTGIRKGKAGQPKAETRPRFKRHGNPSAGQILFYLKGLFAKFGVSLKGLIGESCPPSFGLPALETCDYAGGEEEIDARQKVIDNANRVGHFDWIPPEEAFDQPAWKNVVRQDRPSHALIRAALLGLAGTFLGYHALVNIAVIPALWSMLDT
jgi:hypothetical protein